MNNRQQFYTILTQQLTTIFATDPDYDLAKARYTPAQLASKLTHGLEDGTANKDGKAIKATCKQLGIKHTYTAIREYLYIPV